MKVLVIDGGRNGLGVIRGIAAGRLGCELHVASADKWAPARLSRHVAMAWRVPSPDVPDRWLGAMCEIGARMTDADGPPILLPVNDIFVVLGARHWSVLSQVFRAGFETDADALDRCLAKDRCYDLADSVGVPVPRRGGTVAAYLAGGGVFPAIVKPAIRNTPEFAAARPFRVRLCADEGQLARACADLVDVGATPVIQEFIVGGDDTLVTAGVAMVDGRSIATFTGRKLRQFPPRIGEASYAESIAAPTAAAAAVRLLAAIGYTGLAQVEFKRRGGVDHLLEVNPRSWSWIGLAAASGVNLPAALVAALLGRPMPAANERAGMRWMYASQDMRYHAWSAGLPGVLRWLGQAVSAEVHAHWSWRDPLPVVGLAMALARSAWGKVFRS